MDLGGPWVDLGGLWVDMGGLWVDRGWTVGRPWMGRGRNVGGPWALYVMKVKISDKNTPCVISKYEKSKLSYKHISSSCKSFVYSNNVTSCRQKLELCTKLYISIIFPVALRPNAGHGLLILEVSRSHTATHHSR